MAIEQVPIGRGYYVCSTGLGNLFRSDILPAVERRRTNVASESSKVGVILLMAQEVFPSLVESLTSGVMTVERHDINHKALPESGCVKYCSTQRGN
jgi:hypothetical protein